MQKISKIEEIQNMILDMAKYMDEQFSLVMISGIYPYNNFCEGKRVGE